MFPGFPLAIRAAMATSLGFLAAATALNAVLCFGVLALTNLLAAETIGSRGARVAVAILAFHPLSFYFSIPYTESLFLSASLGAAIAARRGNWHGAAACGAVAVLTRNSGILLLPALLATPVRGERAVSSATAGAGDWRRRWPLVAMPLALGGWMAFTWARWDDPWLWVTAQRAWRQHLQLAWPFAGYVRDLGRYRAYLDHHLPLTTLGLIGVCFAARSLPRPWLLYAAPATLLSVSLSKLAITPRLQLAVFPIWIAWADWLERHVSKRTLLALGAISALVQAGLVWRYCHDLWVD
jgi:hypothetical protein